MEQIQGIEDSMPGCREANIRSCKKINVDFDIFTGNESLTIFDKTFAKRFEEVTGDNLKFFEVKKVPNNRMKKTGPNYGKNAHIMVEGSQQASIPFSVQMIYLKCSCCNEVILEAGE